MSSFYKWSLNYNSTQPPFINARSQLMTFPSTSSPNSFGFFDGISRGSGANQCSEWLWCCFALRKHYQPLAMASRALVGVGQGQGGAGGRGQSSVFGGGGGRSLVCVCCMSGVCVVCVCGVCAWCGGEGGRTYVVPCSQTPPAASQLPLEPLWLGWNCHYPFLYWYSRPVPQVQLEKKAMTFL